MGGRALPVPLVSSAPTGTWRVRAFTDPKRPPVGEATFMVEDYVPDRLEFELASSAKGISKTSRAEVTVDGRYLYGAPAAKLELEGEVIVKPASERPGFARYQFGLTDEDVETARAPLENLPETDANGKARFPVTLEKQPATTRPLEAQITVRMAEPGGRAVERKLTLPVVPGGPMIGVKPLFSGRSLGEGENASFDVILAAPDGTQIARSGLRYELLKVETKYQWYRRDGSWNFEPVKSTKRVADGQIDVAADAPARISVPVQWGRYRLEVSTSDRNGPVTSIGFDAGWYAEASADTPDLLEIALDKPEYVPGESMTVAVTARTAGKVTLNVISDRLITTVTQDVTPGLARMHVAVGNDWGSGAYVVATLRRPLDRQAERMPGRAIGVQWFSVNRKARTLALDLSLPTVIRPNTALRIPVKVGGLGPGEEARIVVAAVDVGILNLTGYKPPAPDDYYLGQRRLTADIRDLYGQLIDGMQGARGQIRTGGDGAVELQGAPPTQKPLALYSGIVTVKPDGTAEVVFDIPDFAGTARVMAVAWSRDKVGRATGDVTIRDPVVLTATLPRFLLNGDRGTMHIEVDNVEGPAGDYRLEVRSEGIAGNTSPQTLKLNAKQRSSVTRAADRGRGRQRRGDRPPQRAGRLCARAQLRARRETCDPNPRAPHGQAARQGRKPHAVERCVRRSRAGNRKRRVVGRPFHRARCRRAAGGARPLSVRVLGADREPCTAAPLCQRSRDLGASRARQLGRPAHPRLHRPAACPPGLERVVRVVVGGRRGHMARLLRHRLPDEGARARICRGRYRLQACRSTGCATSSATRRIPPRTAAAISPTRSMCWRGTARRRSAICAISPTPSSMPSQRRSPRPRSPRRSACSATVRVPSASMPRRWRRSRRSRRSTTAAAITARCCVTRRRW